MRVWGLVSFKESPLTVIIAVGFRVPLEGPLKGLLSGVGV